MSEAHTPETRRVRYLYLDVVEFTRNRSIEAQSDIVLVLGQLVKESLSSLDAPPSEVIYLPTGDGLGIAILDEAASFDIHIQLALRILERVSSHNDSIHDEMRKFQVRFGANENIDNVLLDINGNLNVAGAGINMALRVMSVADASQLLVGQMVYETLSYRERYMNAFRGYQARVKHGVIIPVYQFVEEGHRGLSVAPPSEFVPPLPKERKLTEFEAYYLALAIKNKDFFLRNSGGGQNNYALSVLLWFLANDALAIAHSTDYNPPRLKLFGNGSADLQSAFDYYKLIDFWVCVLAVRYARGQLSGLDRYLEQSEPSALYVVNELGEKKVRAEYPDVLAKLGISTPDA